MSDPHATAPAPQDENQLILERREKLKAIRQRQADGQGVAFPNDFKPSHQAAELFATFDAQSTEELAALEWTKRFPNLRGDGIPAEIEVRPLQGLADFPSSVAADRVRESSFGN